MREKKEISMMKAWFLSLLMAAVLLVHPAQGLAAEPDAMAKEQLESAYKAMEDVKSGTVELEFAVDTMFADASGKLNVDFSAKDAFASQGKFQMTVSDPKNPTTMEYPFYTTEDGKNYILYYQDKGKWYKDVCSKEKEAKVEKDSPAYQALAEEMKDIDEAVRLGDGDAQQQTYVATIDTAKFWSSFGKYVKSTMKLGDKHEKDVQEIFNILGGMGDVEYEVTVDKATNHVVSAKADLTQPIANVMASVMSNPGIDGKTKAFVAMALTDAKLTISIKGSQYNQVSGIKIPDSVVKNAKPAPKNDKNDKKDKK
ncbi:MAG: hypothetical protein IJT01_05830 [Selenomonadaceae bacterium]|nr:hypothetical protein [Selenomonadaceae bacterium]